LVSGSALTIEEKVMQQSLGLFVSALVIGGLVSSAGRAAGLPLVFSTNVSGTTLTIVGQNFGTSPQVLLDNVPFQPVSGDIVNGSEVQVSLAGASLLSHPGTYLLTLNFKNQLPTIFTVQVGATGPAGPTGATGASGPAGAVGPAGPAGAMGPAGAAGPAGPAGSTGAQGPPGLTGATGATGAAGPAGPSGAGTSCPKGSSTTTSGNYVICGDGTLVDTSTGLMWEITTGTLGAILTNPPLTDVNNLYTWTDSNYFSFPYPPTGTLYSVFLEPLNNLVFASSAYCSGFAGHCDWRIPTIGELRTIVASTCPGGDTVACIDPAFGPTVASAYWSSSTYASDPDGAWCVFFGGPGVASGNKEAGTFARAVRGGR
jgi:Protein of unknown function (DUF1566)/Collagen triple helix repeat (20 copies)